MNSAEREMIEQLFGKLEQAERTSVSSGQMPEREALALIRDKVTALPNAPYYMAQAIVMQEQALQALTARVEQLEQELASRPASSGGFLSSLFGGGSSAQRRPQPQPQQAYQQGYGQQGYGQPGYGQHGYGQQGRPFNPAPQGGGFLAGAMQTAVGVAGGVMLGNALSSMFAGDAAASVTEAATAVTDSVAPVAEEGAGFLDGMADFGGGDEESFF